MTRCESVELVVLLASDFQRARAFVGRRVTDDPIELTCALKLAAVLGPGRLAEDAHEPVL